MYHFGRKLQITNSQDQMATKANKLSKFWQELKRRKVIRVITIYAAVAFVILQLVEILAPSLRLPEWTMNFILVLLIVGFIITVIVSWIYDIHPEGGIVKTELAHKVKEEGNLKSSKSWKVASYISFVVIIGLIILNIIPRSNNKKILEKSIAVRPFWNESTEQENESFVNGMTEEIRINLSKIADLRVVSRGSVEKYRDTQYSTIDIAEELNVIYVLEGTAQRVENQVRIHVQLILAENDDHIWETSYTEEIKEVKQVFDIQSQIAQSVARQINAVITKDEIRMIETIPTYNLEAYDMYLKGRYFWNQRTEKGIKEAIEYFLDAVDKDTSYALAYAGLADSYNMVALYGYISSIDAIQNYFQKGKDAAIKALKIDNTLSEAYTSLASFKLYHEWNWIGALKNFEQAIQLNPEYGTARQWYANCLTVFEQHDEAIAEAKRARELDPFTPIINQNVGRRLYFARNYTESIEESLKALSIIPDYFPTLRTLGLSYMQLGMFSEAISELEKAVEYSRDNHYTKAILGYVYGAAGNQTKSQMILNDLMESLEKEYVPSLFFSFIYIGLSDNENAIIWLEKAYEERSPMLIYLNTNPIYDPLRSEPSFIELEEKMGFE